MAMKNVSDYVSDYLKSNKKYSVSRAIEKSVAIALSDKRFFELDRDWNQWFYNPGFSYYAYSIFLNRFGNVKNISFGDFLRYSHSFGYGNWKVENWDNGTRELRDIKENAHSRVQWRNHIKNNM
jgi:hypothetical protein